MIPPFRGVMLVEYRDRIALKPIAAYREIVGLCKIPGGEKDFQPWEGMNPLFIALQKQEDIWLIIQWRRYEDGSEEVISTQQLALATEEEAQKYFRDHIEFLMMPKEKLLELEKCFNVPEADKDYMSDRFPELPPKAGSGKARDLYEARLKVIAWVSPETVKRMLAAEATDDPVQKEYHYREAVSAYYVEMAHYWDSETIKDWQRSNPIAREWICGMARVFAKPQKKLDKVDHEIVLNWLKRKYNQRTADELSEIIFNATGERMSADAIKKRRERLGLTTDRSPGPRSDWDYERLRREWDE